MRISVQQRVGDRIEIEEIADMNRRLDQSVASIERSEGLTQYNGGFIMRSDWPIDKNTFQRRDSAPWPSKPSETLAPDQGSPLIVTTTHPEIDLDATDIDAKRTTVALCGLRIMHGEMVRSNLSVAMPTLWAKSQSLQTTNTTVAQFQ